MAEDRFANVFTAEVTMSAANTLTFVQMDFGMTFRDRIAVVIDELFFYPGSAAIVQMTTAADELIMGITTSDQPGGLLDLADRRIVYSHIVGRYDFGTAASGTLVERVFKQSFSPPLIVLPTRMFFGFQTVGLAAAQTCVMRMHYRTVSITQDQQLTEVLEAFALST